MTILVTGGAGYIGSHMVHALADAGEPVVVLDNLSTGNRNAIPASIPLIVGSTGDRELAGKVIAEHGIDAIIHFAASIVVPESVSDPLSYYRNNTMNTGLLIDAAVKGGVKHFIFSSTAAVYGNPKSVPVNEDATPCPMSPYGTSKLMSEVMLRDASAAHKLHYVVLRYFNVAGADPKQRTGQSTPNATHLIKVACEAAIGKRSKMEIFGTDYPTTDGTCVRDYIHVSDLVAAHLAALKHLRAGGDNAILNCGYGHGHSVREVIAAVEKASGKKLNVTESERRPGDPAQIVADASRIRTMLGWRPRYDDLNTIVTHALAWERRISAR